MAAELRDSWRRTSFDYLVNNAGFGGMAMFADTSEELFDQFKRVMLKGPFFLTQTLLPLLADGGAIVNTTSNSALPPGVEAGFSAYATMKGGLEVLTRYLAKELAPRDPRQRRRARPDPDGDDLRRRRRAVPRGHRLAGGPHRARPPGRRRRHRQGDRRAAVDECGWITGENIEASGGFNL